MSHSRCQCKRRCKVCPNVSLDGPSGRKQRAVKMADGIVTFLEAATSGMATTETERWRFVGLLAPMCGAEWPLLEPIMTEVFASVRGTAGLAPGAGS
jgi:hypothetical protein